MNISWRPALAWVAFLIGAALIFYGAVNSWNIEDVDDEYRVYDPPRLMEVSEFTAVKWFGGQGIKYKPGEFPHQDEYTGVCLA